MERTEWIKQALGMVAMAGSFIWWAWLVEDVFQKVKEGSKHSNMQ